MKRAPGARARSAPAVKFFALLPEFFGVCWSKASPAGSGQGARLPLPEPFSEVIDGLKCSGAS